MGVLSFQALSPILDGIIFLKSSKHFQLWHSPKLFCVLLWEYRSNSFSGTKFNYILVHCDISLYQKNHERHIHLQGENYLITKENILAKKRNKMPFELVFRRKETRLPFDFIFFSAQSQGVHL